jgi:hypothetical protein
MSYGIMPFGVRLALVKRAFGSGDAALVAEITEEFQDHFEADDGDDDGPTLEDALHEIIEGRPLQDGYGHKYGYTLELLCWHFGKFLPNEHFSAMHSDWANQVDRGLFQAGVPEETFSLTGHLMFRGSPVPIPERDDFPSIGYLKAAEVGPALRAIKTADLAGLDPEVRDAVGDLRGWLEACSKAVCDLVCFYH